MCFQVDIDYRLPSDLSPNRYELTIQPYFKPTEMPEIYKASMIIEFTCLHDTDKLVLHMNNDNLKLDNSSLRLSSPTDSSFVVMENFKWTYDSVRTFFTAHLTGTQRFRPGQNYTFEVSFEGKVLNDLVGFYRDSYKYIEDGVEYTKSHFT